jgi:hypothetical protein
MPFTGKGFEAAAQAVISAIRSTPQTIRINGQNREMYSSNGSSGYSVRARSSAPSPIRSSGATNEFLRMALSDTPGAGIFS